MALSERAKRFLLTALGDTDVWKEVCDAFDASSSIGTGDIEDSSITTAKINNSSVTQGKLEPSIERYRDTLITSSDFMNCVGTPIVLVPTPGAGFATIVTAVYTTLGYSNISTRENGTITCVANTASSLNNKYFLIDGANGTNWYVWFNCNNAGTRPVVANRREVMVSLGTSNTNAQVATALAAALTSRCSSITHVTPSVADVTFDQTTSGVGNCADGTAATGFTIVYSGPKSAVSYTVTGGLDLDVKYKNGGSAVAQISNACIEAGSNNADYRLTTNAGLIVENDDIVISQAFDTPAGTSNATVRVYYKTVPIVL